MTDPFPTFRDSLQMPDRAVIAEGEDLMPYVDQLPWRDVESSNIARIAFCRTCEIPTRLADGGSVDLGWLWVHFRSGKIYAYDGVPAASFVAIEVAESPTRMFNALIKEHYRYAGFDPKTGQTFVEGERR